MENLPISAFKKFKYSIYFQTFDEESLEMGDKLDSGYEKIESIDTIGDILKLANSTYGIYYPVSLGNWESTEPLSDKDYYEKGIHKFFYLHIQNEDGTDISLEENDFITFLLSDGSYNSEIFEEYAVGGIVTGAIAIGVGALITYFYFKNKKDSNGKPVNSRAKSVTHIINGKERKFPIKDAWKREHSVQNKKEKYEVPQADRKPVKFEMGGDASEYYHEVEYGEGGVARAKDVIMNKIGINEENADFLVSQSEKFSIWLADSIIKKFMIDRSENKKTILESINSHPDYISRFFRREIREILDWLQHPVTEKQDLRNLSFDEALEKAKEWHNELQVLGGDIDFTEPEKNTILKKYPKNSDGIEYYWVFIPSNYCDLESSRMGHCGRTGYGNNLISLRSIKPYGKGHTISDSHVTIAYGVNDGIFYQIKGKKNNKPAEKYFPYVFDLIKSMSNNSINFNFEGFGSEYGDNEDYGFQDMTNEEIRELYELKPSIFTDAESILAIFDAGVIDTEELKGIINENTNFNTFGNQIKLYERGIISEEPSTIVEINYGCDDVVRLLNVDRDFSEDIVEKILCGDIGELYDGWSYYYENPSDLVGNLNKENEQSVIDEIVRITGLDESVVKENGIEYYLNGDDDDFSKDDFDNIIRILASAQNSADNSDYYKYLYDAIESALNNLGEVKSLNYEGVKMTIDLSNYMSLEEIADSMERYEFEDVSNLFSELIARSEIELPNLRIDDRYTPYGSSQDFNEYVSDADLESGFEKGGQTETKMSYEDFVETLQEYEIEGGFGKTLEKGLRMYYLPKENPYLNTKFNHRNMKKAYKQYLEMKRYADGGSLKNLKNIANKYLENEDNNNHSENVVLLATHFGTKEDLKKAKEILALHNSTGSLTSENGKERQKLHSKLIEKARKEMSKEGIKFEKGGEAGDLEYSDILEVLESKITDSIEDLPNKFEGSYEFKGEEVEHESRDGFIPYTDGGYEAIWFERLSGMWSSGHNLPTKQLDDEMNRQINYNLETAKNNFIENYPDIVEEIGEENIDYNSLYEAGYESEAEELSEDENEMMSEDTIMMQISAYYYSPENVRAKDGKHTIRLFGDVNLESPYHRQGNLDDSFDVDITFDSLSELEEKVDEGLKQIISWFDGDMYNDSTAEIKVRRMAEGGEMDDDDFKVHGYYTISNAGGYEIELADSGDSARVRDAYGSDNPEISDWLEIEYVENEDGDVDEDGNLELVPVIDPNGYNIPLNMVMRANYKKGGRLSDKATYLGKRDIESIKTVYGQTIAGKKLLDGNYVKGKLNKPKMSRTQFEEETFEYAEGGEVQDWMEEALASLIEETGFDDLEITIVSDNGNEFYATDDNVEYRVFKTVDDAEEVAVEQVSEDLRENPEYFNKDFLMNHIDGREFFEGALNEMNDSYVEDIESESDSKYANRLIAELVENGLMDDEDAESDNAEELTDNLKSDYINLLTESQLNEGNNGLDYFISNFGEEETYKMIVDRNLIDIDEASIDAVNIDGIGHFLSSYDGETLYLSNDCVAYRVN